MQILSFIASEWFEQAMYQTIDKKIIFAIIIKSLYTDIIWQKFQ